ncbi:MAG: PIN domain-containing protein [Candidatus Micrarchaeota archaeon]
MELKQYIPEVADRYNLNEEFVKETIYFIENNMEIIPKEDYGNIVEQIKNEISDKDDLPLLALATIKNISI